MPGDPVDAARRERFEALFREHYPDILAYAVRRLADRSAAEEVAAEVFLVAWRRGEDVPAPPLPWLYGVARKVIANSFRSRTRRARLLGRLASEPAPEAIDVARALD